VASWRSTWTKVIVVVRLEPLAAEHATWLSEFLVSHDWPFHAESVDRDLVTERLRHGYYDGTGRATFVVTDGPQRTGLVRVEDLDDPTPTFDLRIAAAHRGQGHGTAALRELARWVFDTHDVERLEGATRQDNVAMRRTFRAVGFVKEAHYRRGWPAQDGRLLDAVGYALLRPDWRDGTPTPVDWNDEPDTVDGPDGV
jgi:RimJ/RimL family protein N-acetyltransferase